MLNTKALFVGINHYKKNPLYGCINDANDMADLMREHENEDPNFRCDLLTSDKYATDLVTLRKKLQEWYSDEADISLFFFSGHGVVTSSGGFFCPQNASVYNEGIHMSEILNLANGAARKRIHRQVVIILDCCQSAAFGELDPNSGNASLLEEGVVILTASGKNQFAKEDKRNGVFTSILLNGLKGEAADLLGRVTISSLYNHADQQLDILKQRPRFKANLQKEIVLRRNKPKIDLVTLRKIAVYFEEPDDPYRLNITFEPLDTDGVSPNPKAIKKKVKIFKDLQKFNQYGLVRPYDLPADKDFMYFAALYNTGCRLTPLGRHYWKMAKQKLF